jgi:threonine dehydratase
VTEFNYRYASAHEAHVFVGVQVQNRDETARLIRMLRRHGLKTVDFTDSELAKLHVRHLVGGHAPGIDHEIIYRFEFPERPGALMRFLNSMRHGWNISLFHYRNHGADHGRVLVGMQVPPGDKPAFNRFLAKLGYGYSEETRDPAYRLFLS